MGEILKDSVAFSTQPRGVQERRVRGGQKRLLGGSDV